MIEVGRFARLVCGLYVVEYGGLYRCARRIVF